MDKAIKRISKANIVLLLGTLIVIGLVNYFVTSNFIIFS